MENGIVAPDMNMNRSMFMGEKQKDKAKQSK